MVQENGPEVNRRYTKEKAKDNATSKGYMV